MHRCPSPRRVGLASIAARARASHLRRQRSGVWHPGITRGAAPRSDPPGLSVFVACLDHPGGAHYLIHATDHPRFAARGLAAARAYAKIAPDAEHALHMPSLIFVQIGAWGDAIASNERAWAASVAGVKASRGPESELNLHVLGWLQYGYLQQGRFREARALVDSVRKYLD
ncbi:MAG: hypothetical protein WKF55_14230 [Gemmatimonadaceae bacterium]